jgi:branched-chain amino acid transport system substrate-binding protein
VSLVFEDDQLQPARTVSAFNKLISSDRVDGLLVFGTGGALAVNAMAEKAKIPMVAVSVDQRVVQGKSYVMKYWARLERLTDSVSSEVKGRGYKRIAVVATENDAMLGLKKRFADQNPSLVISAQSVLPDERDFSVLASKLIKLNPDAVYLLLYPPQSSIFAKQLRAVGFKGGFFGAHPLENSNEIKAAAGALDHAWFASGAIYADPKFKDRYYKNFSVRPENGAPCGYDVVKMVIEASRSNKPLNAFLHELKDFQGLSGVFSATLQNDFDIPTAVKTVRDEFLTK